MNLQYIRIILPFGVLFLFYWSIYVIPGPQQSGNKANANELTPEESRELLDLSRTQIRESKYEEALSSTLRLHDAYPNNHVYIQQLATIYNSLSRYKEEAEMWEGYLKIAPTPDEACPHIGEAYRKLGLMDKSIDACERCLALDAKNTDSIFFLARAYELSNQLDKAKKLYEQGAELSPLYSDQSIGLARIHLRQGRVRQAREIVGKIVEQEPNNVDALLVYAMALRMERKYAEAKEYLERGLKLSPNYTDFYIVLGGIAEQQGDIEQAINYYNRALEISPENRDLAARRDRLRGGRS